MCAVRGTAMAPPKRYPTSAPSGRETAIRAGSTWAGVSRAAGTPSGQGAAISKADGQGGLEVRVVFMIAGIQVTWWAGVGVPGEVEKRKRKTSSRVGRAEDGLTRYGAHPGLEFVGGTLGDNSAAVDEHDVVANSSAPPYCVVSRTVVPDPTVT